MTAQPHEDEQPTFEDMARRIDELRDQVHHQEPAVQRLLDDTIAAITEFNRQGLIALVHLLREDERGGQQAYAPVRRAALL